MKDIDFDELDRAVSSLMNTVPDAPPPVTNDDATRVVTLNIEETPQKAAPSPESNQAVPPRATENSSVENPSTPVSSDDTSPAEPVAALTPSPAARRGRFMDVVRPAGRDTRKPFQSNTISRQGPTLQPTSTPTSETAVPEKNTLIEEEPSDSPYEIKAADTEHENPASFDPVMQSYEDTAMTTEQTSTEGEYAEETPPLVSPFLPDAKVEKRPLGRAADANGSDAENQSEPKEGANPSELPEEPINPTEDSISPNRDAQLPEQPLPAELGSELLSIETSTTGLPQEEATPEATPAAPVVAPEVNRPMPTETAMPLSSGARARTVTSIPQQYKVQPTMPTEDAPSGAIYDTQPLAHPAKKKPGWLWVVAILAMALLGAGGAATVYYLGWL